MKKIYLILTLLISFSSIAALNITNAAKSHLGVVEFVSQKTKLVTIYGNDKKKYRIEMKNVFSNPNDDKDKSQVSAGKAVFFIIKEDAKESKTR